MPVTDCEANPTLPDSQSPDCQNCDMESVAEKVSEPGSKPPKGLFFGFAATVTIGLALASWYVAVRIVSADAVAASSQARTSPSAAMVSPPANPPSATGEDSMAEAYWYAAPAPELYLQVAALGGQQDTAFKSSLEARGFHAQIQVRRSSNERNGERILIGPFATRTALEQAQRQLRSSGILAIETAY